MQTQTTTVFPSNPDIDSTSGICQVESLYELAERRLRELVEAGNIEAIKLALNRNPTGVQVTW